MTSALLRERSALPKRSMRASPVLLVPQAMMVPETFAHLNQHPYVRAAVVVGSPASVEDSPACAPAKLNAFPTLPSAPATATIEPVPGFEVSATPPVPSSVSAPAVKLYSRTGEAGKSPTTNAAPRRRRRTASLTRVGTAASRCAILAQYKRRIWSSVR